MTLRFSRVNSNIALFETLRSNSSILQVRLVATVLIALVRGAYEAGRAATWGARSRPRLRPGHGLTDEITVAIPIVRQRDLHGRTHSMVAFDYPMGRGIWDLRCRRSPRISLRSHRVFSRNQLFDCPDLNCTTCAGNSKDRYPRYLSMYS